MWEAVAMVVDSPIGVGAAKVKGAVAKTRVEAAPAAVRGAMDHSEAMAVAVVATTAVAVVATATAMAGVLEIALVRVQRTRASEQSSGIVHLRSAAQSPTAHHPDRRS